MRKLFSESMLKMLVRLWDDEWVDGGSYPDVPSPLKYSYYKITAGSIIICMFYWLYFPFVIYNVP